MNEQVLLPVAQYLRMSTTHQRYSIDNQRLALEMYAREHGMSIVATYSDPGCSGLELKHRSGLRQLLQDVVSKPAFRAIIVYDVSRWGRFQDPDEAAHYEFICKSAGAPVHYSSELFTNDGGVANLLLKQLKRTMAGEFSRELGVKVYAGQKNLARLGHRMGGIAGYGLRRCLIMPDGTRRVLEVGQRKVASTDRIILVPGPDSEVKLIREMFDLVLRRSKPPATIARLLNERGSRPPSGLPWTHHNITEILTNRKYVGVNVWGRTSARLKSTMRRVPESEWITKEDAFEAIVDQSRFDRVQRWMGRRTLHRSDEELLNDLKRLWRRAGSLSQQLITTSDITPIACTYQRRFGSLRNAYGLIGYTVTPKCNEMISRRSYRNALRDRLILSFRAALPSKIEIVKGRGRKKPMLLVGGNIPCGVTICPALVTTEGKTRWLVRVRKDQQNYPVLMCVLDRENVEIKRMFMNLPTGRSCWHTRTEYDLRFRESIRIRSARQLCSALSRYANSNPISLREVPTKIL